MSDTIIGKSVTHNKYGLGKIISKENNKILVQFEDQTIKFIYPEAFRDKFLEIVDLEFLEQVTHDLQLKQSEREQELLRYQAVKPIPSKSKQTTRKGERSNVAFKCTYCNGGKIPGETLGFNGVCTDRLIRYNIREKGHVWCSDEDSLCKMYLDGMMRRSTLEGYLENNGMVCYESVMLRDWAAYAGYTRNGEKRDEPIKLKQVQTNSLAILTTREPNTAEKQRIIFGVFIIDENYEGDNREEGYVTTHSDWKIALLPDEAHKMLFWKYYANGSSPKKPHWGTGLFRYLSDEQAIQILRDIVAVRKKQSDKDFAQRFLDHYCTVSKLNKANVAPPSGALLGGST